MNELIQEGKSYFINKQRVNITVSLLTLSVARDKQVQEAFKNRYFRQRKLHSS